MWMYDNCRKFEVFFGVWVGGGGWGGGIRDDLLTYVLTCQFDPGSIQICLYTSEESPGLMCFLFCLQSFVYIEDG